jgi:hypothetical protein
LPDAQISYARLAIISLVITRGARAVAVAVEPEDAAAGALPAVVDDLVAGAAAGFTAAGLGTGVFRISVLLPADDDAAFAAGPFFAGVVFLLLLLSFVEPVLLLVAFLAIEISSCDLRVGTRCGAAIWSKRPAARHTATSCHRARRLYTDASANFKLSD